MFHVYKIIHESESPVQESLRANLHVGRRVHVVGEVESKGYQRRACARRGLQ